MTRGDFTALWNTWQARYIIFGAWSLAALEVMDGVLRRLGYRVELVSQCMKRLAFSGLTAIAFFAGSMAVHWFVTWHRATWSGLTADILGVFFWLVFAAYVVASYADPTPRYWPVLTQYLRYPPIAAVLGGLLAWICFPQESAWLPGKAT